MVFSPMGWNSVCSLLQEEEEEGEEAEEERMLMNAEVHRTGSSSVHASGTGSTCSSAPSSITSDSNMECDDEAREFAEATTSQQSRSRRRRLKALEDEEEGMEGMDVDARPGREEASTGFNVASLSPSEAARFHTIKIKELLKPTLTSILLEILLQSTSSSQRDHRIWFLARQMQLPDGTVCCFVSCFCLMLFLLLWLSLFLSSSLLLLLLLLFFFLVVVYL